MVEPNGNMNILMSLSNRREWLWLLFAAVFMVAGVLGFPKPAEALKAIAINADQDRIEVTSLGELYDNRGDSLQIETAADAGIVAGRMTVRASVPGSNPTWLAFALHNTTDRPIERWLTAERYTMFGSGAVWPDLDARRIEALTPSLGFVPERIKSDRADILRITVEPGQTITYVVEFSGQRFSRVNLWRPLDYEFKARDRQLFNGVLLGLTGLLAIFLTAVFAANHKVIFPSAALVAWAVLLYLTVEFGFFHKLFQLKVDDYAVYRAATEAAVAASLVMFLDTFLRFGRAPSLIRMLLGLWVAGQIALVAIAVIDPRLAATFARISFVAVGGIGAFAIGILALRGEDRALALVPTWLLLLVWVFGSAMILTGRLSTELAASGMLAGLVLIVVLIGFTVTQFAFRSLEPAYSSGFSSSEQHVAALAVEASGAALFEWLVPRNEVKVSPMVDQLLGHQAGTLSTKLAEFLKYVHEADRDRVRLAFSSVQSKPGAILSSEFRLRHADNSTRWFEIEAAGLPGADPRSNRFVGLVRDITETRRAHDQLVHDAIHCSLTGIPNRGLFLDRLSHAMERARSDDRLRPTVVLIDLDRFKTINAQHGMPIGDSLLMTITRRLQHHITRKDMLARLSGDKFAMLFEDERQPHEFAREAEQIRRAIRAPIRIKEQDIVVTGSLGIAIFDGTEKGHLELLEAAEIAVAKAKQSGVDRIEIFRPEMRGTPPPSAGLASDLERALAKGQMKLLYQPIIYLPTEELAGFEATVRIEHGELGSIDPTTVELPPDSDLINRIWSQALGRAAKDAARWQTELPRVERALFVSFNVASASLFKPDLAREVRRILDHGVLPKGSLRLEIAETLVVNNPEQAAQVLAMLDGVGAELTLDGFGAGYTGLASLTQPAFDTVKLDRDLVEAADGGDTDAAPSVRSLVAMSLELGKKVAANGVEHPEAVAFLRKAGCVYAQGFYYGDPMPDRDVLQLLKLVRKAERSLAPRGLFRRSQRKAKDGTQPIAAVAAASAKPDGQRVRAGRSGEKSAPAPQSSMPSSTMIIPGSMPAGSFPPQSMPPGSMPDGGPYAMEPTAHDPNIMMAAQYEPNMPHDMIEPVGFQPPMFGVPPQPFAPSDTMATEEASLTNDLAYAIREADMSDAAIQNGHHAEAHHGHDPIAILGAAMTTVPSANGHAAGGANGANGSQAKDSTANHSQSPGQFPAARIRQPRAAPDLSKLPPGLAASLAKLANGGGSPANPLAPPRPSTIPALSTVVPDRGETN